MSQVKDCKLLGIWLSSLSISDAVARALSGGLILAPSGPGLCDLETDLHYREALENADLNLPDSGLAILMALILRLGKLPRTSGLGFLEALLKNPALREPNATFWVMPSEEAQTRNIAWLKSNQIPVEEQNCLIAPLYPRIGPVIDSDLLAAIIKLKPRFIFVCTGSGSQEKLGFWLKQNLPYRPTTCCIGAAIGFLSGDQIRIPKWGDLLCLGWLLRCLSEPTKFIPRYAKATRLIWLILRYRDKAPTHISGSK
jgi:N-acetylglucosaminyldiphosphoundecaprenol N-acetyl-beta-D-mannosaminyltransferase